MEKNVGRADRVIRALIGLVLLSLPVWLEASWSWLGFIGLAPLLTALEGNCPGYRLFGISSCPSRKFTK